MRKANKNAGFSLVELIIVIAIMAVLVALLSTQYLRYVKQTKVSSDILNATRMATAVNAALADDSVPLRTPSTGVITVEADDLPNVMAYPKSEVDASYTWEVQVDSNGLLEIDLGGCQIWPNPNDPSNGYRTHNL